MDWIRGELLWVRPGREAEGAVFVVRKALGKAVDRNRMKRRLRHLYRACEPVAGSVVVLVRPPAMTCAYATLGQDLQRLLSRMSAARPQHVEPHPSSAR